MKIGLSVSTLHAVKDPREGPRRILARVAAARDAGLDMLFLGDHHATPAPYYQNVPMLGRALAAWDAGVDEGRPARPFGALYLLPLWHPLTLAEQVGTLAAIGAGRFILQCGLGWGAPQFAAFGQTEQGRVRRFEAALPILRALWAGERVTRTDGPWPMTDAHISPRPAEPVEVWIGASAPAAIERAGRLGDGWLADPAMDLPAAAAALERYRAACRGAGRATGHAAIRRDVLVAATPADAERRLDEALAAGGRGFPRDALLAGDPAQVAARLLEFARAGYGSVHIRCIEADQDRALETLTRFGEVRARLLDALGDAGAGRA